MLMLWNVKGKIELATKSILREPKFFLSRIITIIQELQELCSQVPKWKSPHDQLPPPSVEY